MSSQNVARYGSLFLGPSHPLMRVTTLRHPASSGSRHANTSNQSHRPLAAQRIQPGTSPWATSERRRTILFSHRNLHTQSPSKENERANDDHKSKAQADPPKSKPKSAMLKRDQELLAKLLDREGGTAGVSIVDGAYEEGLGRETKKNMFRLI